MARALALHARGSGFDPRPAHFLFFRARRLLGPRRSEAAPGWLADPRPFSEIITRHDSSLIAAPHGRRTLKPRPFGSERNPLPYRD